MTDDEPLIDCPNCGGSGFSGRGSGYDAVCGECGGQRQMPAQFYAEEAVTEPTQTTEPQCECGGPPCRICPEVSCRYMTKNEWVRQALDRLDEREAP